VVDDRASVIATMDYMSKAMERGFLARRIGQPEDCFHYVHCPAIEPLSRRIVTSCAHVDYLPPHVANGVEWTDVPGFRVGKLRQAARVEKIAKKAGDRRDETLPGVDR
jgi:hypothetical protein